MTFSDEGGRKMKIIFAELKKIFSFKNVIPLLLVFAVLFVFFDMYSINALDSESSWEYDIVKEYGTNLSEDEIEKIRTEYAAKLTAEINALIAENDLLGRIGVEKYEDYRTVQNGGLSIRINDDGWLKEMLADKTLDDEEFERSTGMTREEASTPPSADEIAAYETYFSNPDSEIYQLVKKLGSLDSQIEYQYVKRYEIMEIMLSSETAVLSQASKERLKEIFETDEFCNIIDDDITWKLNSFSIEIFIVTLACVYVFLLPVLTRDNMTGVSYLQYSSKGGRKILSKQLISMLIAAAAVSAFICGYDIIKTMAEIPSVFYDCRLNGFNNIYSHFWFRGTVLQYIFSVSGVVMLFSLALSFFLFVVSHTSKNYIQLIIKSIPVVAVFGGYAFIYGEKTFMFNEHNAFSDVVPVAYAEAYLAVLLFVIGLAVSLIVIKRNKVRDIL